MGNRRQVLKAIGSGAAASIISTNSVSACDEPDIGSAAESYRNPDKIEEIAVQHSSFIEALHRRGLLNQSQITIDRISSHTEYLNSENAVHVWGIWHPKGVSTALITIRRTTEAGRVVISFVPDLDNRKPVLYHMIDSEIADIYRPGEKDIPIERKRVRVFDKRLRDVDPNELVAQNSSGRNEGVSIQGTTGNFCVNKGDAADCGSYSCYAWKGECVGDDDCNLYECTGEYCCDGCCCCEDVDHCCKVCGDGICDSDPCDGVSWSCHNGGCCNCC